MCIRDRVIASSAIDTIKKSWRMRDPIRMLTITAINLCDENQAQQLSLFSNENVLAEKGEKVERAMDNIRKKFGTGAISFGSIINNDIGLDAGSTDPAFSDVRTPPDRDD